MADSAAASSWTERLAREMHEIGIDTSVFSLRVVCHDLRVIQLSGATGGSGFASA